MPSDTKKLADVSEGMELPPFDLPITSSLVVGGALATNDYTPVHHDRAAALANGLPDVFLNILTTNGLCVRVATDWAGPDALVRGVNLKLGGPALPGDTLKFRSKVLSVAAPEVEVEVTGTTSWGNHVTAKIRLELPA